MTRQIRLLTIGFLVLGLCVAGLIQGGRAPRANVAMAAGVATVPFDDVPGLGRTSSTGLRDDSLAYYEAWQRDAAVADCMRDAGFSWQPEALFPGGAVVELAGYLGISYSPELSAEPAELNRTYAASLIAEELDRYDRALYGESALDLGNAAAKGGQVPVGRDAAGFANGGCIGSSKTSGSIWDLRRRLGPDFDDLSRRIMNSSRMQQGIVLYRNCGLAKAGLLASNPSQLLELGRDSSGGTRESVLQAATECEPIWTQAMREATNDAAPDFLASHESEFQLQKELYAARWNEMLASTDYAAFVARTASRVAAGG